MAHDSPTAAAGPAPSFCARLATTCVAKRAEIDRMQPTGRPVTSAERDYFALLWPRSRWNQPRTEIAEVTGSLVDPSLPDEPPLASTPAVAPSSPSAHDAHSLRPVIDVRGVPLIVRPQSSHAAIVISRRSDVTADRPLRTGFPIGPRDTTRSANPGENRPTEVAAKGSGPRPRLPAGSGSGTD